MLARAFLFRYRKDPRVRLPAASPKTRHRYNQIVHVCIAPRGKRTAYTRRKDESRRWRCIDAKCKRVKRKRISIIWVIKILLPFPLSLFNERLFFFFIYIWLIARRKASLPLSPNYYNNDRWKLVWKLHYNFKRDQSHLIISNLYMYL